MGIPALTKQKFIFIFTLIYMAKLHCHSGYAEDAPGQMAEEALSCFNDKIYSGCSEAYRLTESGNVNVPPEATDLFCNGPCLTETQAILSCINNILSDFLFYNRATVRDIRYVLNAGCSYSSLRGDFNVTRYIEGETSSAYRLAYFLGFLAFTCVTFL